MSAAIGSSPLSAGSGQEGAVLLLAMVFLLLLALVASTLTRSGTLQFQMAGNEQFREEAFQNAQAIVSALVENESNFPVTGGIGFTLCDTSADCDAPMLNVGTATTALAPGVKVAYHVERKGPRFVDSLPFRSRERGASSAQYFDAALFEVSADVDGSAVRQGRATIVEGVARRVPSFGQQGVVDPL